MKFLIIGLGSMGKRRINNLMQGDNNELDMWDIKDEDSIPFYYFESQKERYDALIISTPPNYHNEYIKKAIEWGKPCFVEASVVLDGLEELNESAKKKGVLIAPSCTMLFNDKIREIKEFVRNNKVLNFTYHLGQYLPDWHNGDTNFYAFKKETGGAREMVSFEMTWITDIFGYPKRIVGLCGKTENWDIDDTYAFSVDFGETLGSILIDVVSRGNYRELVLFTDKGEKRFDLSEIPEEMYLEEMKVFISAMKGEKEFPNTLDKDIKILKLLKPIENGGTGTL